VQRYKKFGEIILLENIIIKIKREIENEDVKIGDKLPFCRR
jgi:DNA-binding GntR family transcriptional regulator